MRNKPIRRVQFQSEKFAREHQETRYPTGINLIIEVCSKFSPNANASRKSCMKSMQVDVVDESCLMADSLAIGVNQKDFSPVAPLTGKLTHCERLNVG